MYASLFTTKVEKQRNNKQAKSAFMYSRFSQLCEEFFSLFFYKGARKGD